MRSKHIVSIIFSILIATLLFPNASFAISVEPPPAPHYSDIFVSALQVSSKVEFIELHNDTDQPVDLSSWSINLYSSTTTSSPFCSLQLANYLLANGYVVATQSTTFAKTNNLIQLYGACGTSSTAIKKVELVEGAKSEEVVLPLSNTAGYVRKGVTKTYRTDVFDKDFYDMTNSAARKSIYAGEWYIPSQTTWLQVQEILPNARDCSPLEEADDCDDYVKFFNPTDTSINLTNYRLRVGYKGQTPSSSNSYALRGIVQPGSFISLKKDKDGKTISITNSGGFVWLEDAYGVKRYDSTIQSYPNASSETKGGKSWAYDDKTGKWKWGIPSPDDINQFPLPVAEKPKAIATYTPCRADQYRSEETHRCRSKVALAAASLVPCKPGQYRSLDTNRCRNLTTASSSLVPCRSGQKRNPETNRCRNVVSTAPESAFAVEPVKDTGKAFVGWWALGGIGLLAAGRAGWEWREEIIIGIRKVASFFVSSK